jgi:hypothetical protein
VGVYGWTDERGGGGLARGSVSKWACKVGKKVG